MNVAFKVAETNFIKPSKHPTPFVMQSMQTDPDVTYCKQLQQDVNENNRGSNVEELLIQRMATPVIITLTFYIVIMILAGNHQDLFVTHCEL